MNIFNFVIADAITGLFFACMYGLFFGFFYGLVRFLFFSVIERKTP
jgi:NhaP-type Na+/H+ or K+/H+ antiporter